MCNPTIPYNEFILDEDDSLEELELDTRPYISGTNYCNCKSEQSELAEAIKFFYDTFNHREEKNNGR